MGMVRKGFGNVPLKDLTMERKRVEEFEESLCEHCGWILSTNLLALFHAKFAYILAISNPVFRWDSCKGSMWESVKKCSRLCKDTRTRDWISRVGHDLQAARSCISAKHTRSWSVSQLEHYKTKSTDWLFSYLAAGTRDSIKPRV